MCRGSPELDERVSSKVLRFSSAGWEISAPGEDGNLQPDRASYGHRLHDEPTEPLTGIAADKRLDHRICTPVASAGCMGVPTSAPPLSGAPSIAMAVGNRTVTIYGNGWKSRWFPAEFDDISHIIFWSGLYGYEKGTIPVIPDQVRQARCFIDVGANCGIYTVLGATVNPRARMAVEPVPRVQNCQT
jgi:hypothetical protein